MRVALIRHPRPLVSAGHCYGRLDLDVHADAALQIRVVAAGLAGFQPHAVWASPARRCRAMADAVAHQAGVCAQRDLRLLELDFGAWEGKSWDDLPRAALDRWAADPWGFAEHGGESGTALVARVSAFCTTLLEEERDCAVIAHAGPLKVMAALLAGREVDLLAPSQDLASILWVTSERQQAEDDGLGADGDRAQNVAGMAADLSRGQARHGQTESGGNHG